MDRVVIGDENDQHVSIVVLRRDSHDAGDGRWLLMQVSVRAGQWIGKFKACVRTEELVAFRQRLESLHKSPGRVANCGSLENWLALQLTVAGPGRILVQGAAIDECGTGKLLKFNFEIDQSDLPAIIAQLQTIEQKLPVRGWRK